MFDYVLCEQCWRRRLLGPDLAGRSAARTAAAVFHRVFHGRRGVLCRRGRGRESALDGYLLKPFTPSALFERLSLARLRKIHLRPIFDAIEAEDFERAAQLCVERFESRQPYWLYAARIGSELLLRLGSPRRGPHAV